MARNIVTGIDLGTAFVRIAVVEYSAGNKIPRVLALVKKEAHGLRRGYIVNFDEAVDSIHDAVQEAEQISKTKIRQAFISIGGITLEAKTADGSTMITKADGEVTSTDLARAMQAGEQTLPDAPNRRVLHNLPIAAKVDGKRVLGQAEGMRGAKLEVRTLFITCLTQHLQDFVRAMEMAGVGVEDIVAAPIAASLVTLTKLQKSAGCMLVNIGSQTTSVVVFEEDAPLSLQVFPLGSNDITHDIALGLRVPIEEAERLKITTASDAQFSRKKLDEIIEARLTDIFDYLEAHLKKIGRSELLPAGAIVSGGGGAIPHIESLASSHLKLPASNASKTLQASSKNQIKDPAWSVAYGLCVFGADGASDSGSFFPRSNNGFFKLMVDNFKRWSKEFMP